MGPIGARAEWKSSTMDSGERFVMTSGACQKQQWYAGRRTVGPLSQSSTRPSLEEVKIRFGWTMLSALVTRNPLPTARTEV